MKQYTNVHLGEQDQVLARDTRETPTGLVVTSVEVGDLYFTGPPRVLRRIFQEMEEAAAEAVRREDRLTDLRDMQAGVDRFDEEQARTEYEATR